MPLNSTSGEPSSVLRHSVILEPQSEAPVCVEGKGARFLIHSNLRILTRAIASLSKLGSDLYLEPSAEGLAVKSFNKSKSAYGIFLFSADFFSQADATDLPDHPTKNLCRISMKSALSIFRGLQVSDKSFISCEFVMDPSSDFFVVQLVLAYDVTRTFQVNMLESNTAFRSTIDKSKLRNCTITSAETLMSILQEIHSKSEELIIYATENEFKFKNNFPRENDLRKLINVKTEASIPLDVFSRHNAPRSTELSLSLKEFMAAFTFASQHQVPISMYYDAPGKPLILALEGDINYTAEYIIATVETDDLPADEYQQINTQNLPRSQQSQAGSARSQRPVSQRQASTSSQQRRRPETEVPNPAAGSLNAERSQPASQRQEPEIREPSSKQRRLTADQSRLTAVEPQQAADHSRVTSVEPHRTADEPSREDEPRQDQSVGGGQLRDDFPDITWLDLEAETVENMPLEADNDQMGRVVEADEPLPATPPPKDSQPVTTEPERTEAQPQKVPKSKRENKFRRFFLSSTSATQRVSQRLADATVLAADSQEMDES